VFDQHSIVTNFLRSSFNQGKQRKQNKKNCQRKIADFLGKVIRVLLLSPNFFSSIGLNRFKQSTSGYAPTLKSWKIFVA